MGAQKQLDRLDMHYGVEVIRTDAFGFRLSGLEHLAETLHSDALAVLWPPSGTTDGGYMPLLILRNLDDEALALAVLRHAEHLLDRMHADDRSVFRLWDSHYWRFVEVITADSLTDRSADDAA